ncbi:MAG: cytochrome P450 [Acidobacteriales bacterium]|nr:cytochrome P450 [Terriglobales bacterium]
MSQISTETQAAESELFTPKFFADPYSTYRRMLAAGPVHRLDVLGGGVWAVVRYAECFSLLRDQRLSSHRAHYFVSRLPVEQQGEFGEFTRLMGQWMLFRDAPEHTRLRKLMNKGFSPALVEAMRPHIQDLVDELLDKVQNTGRMEGMGDLAYPLPALVICEMLGVRAEDRDRLIQCSDDIAVFLASPARTVEMAKVAQHAILEVTGYFRNLVRERRTNRSNDLISLLIGIEEDGEVLTEEEVYAQCLMLLWAGHETTRNLIGNGLWALLRHPDQMEDLRADPALIRSAVEELLRYESPAQAFSRTALEDFDLDGSRIQKGETIILIVAAANRDPRQFENPDQLNLRRSKNTHLAFGAGAHFCIGNALARLEGQVVIQTLLHRFPNLRLADPPPEWGTNFNLRGLRHLHVTL